MEISLQDKVAIVTGAGQGLGEAIAHALAGAGAKVAVNDLNPDRAERVAAAIRAAGGEAIGVVADVSNKFQCVSLVEATREAWGRLDVLVNNAGIEPVSPILTMDEWDWTRCIDVNLKGVFFMSQLVGRVMAEENLGRGGAIVNISSIAGVEIPLMHRAAYCASKAGMVGFARECAREFAAYGIRVNTIVAGVFITPMTEKARQNPAMMEKWMGEIPLRRLGDADEIARVALFLCSDAASYMTGSTITVDGGKVMR
ncbi:MAG: SDR family oxidoreductase [Ardenticatenales bacterium]|nr:SDR family oxidoreductase [Ardenticatenales bacterium]